MSDFRKSAVPLAGGTALSSVVDEEPAGGVDVSIARPGLLAHLKGADQPSDIARQLEQWHGAVTSPTAEARFTLGDRLGEGAQGVVYRLVDRDCRREVAMKNLRAEECDAGDISRFVHEAQITAQLEHPGIVPVHDFGVLPDGTAFYTMKRVEGESLSEWMVDREGCLEHRFDLLSCFLRICEPVEFAHSKGVIHRDLKPRNIMVGRFGEVLVMDWGLAKVVGVVEGSAVSSLRSDGESSSGDTHQTMQGVAVGTPAYMSPEQARGDSHLVDQRSDLYGLGVILYEMLTGESPYQRGDARRTLDQVADGQIRPIDEGRLGDGGHRLAAIVRKAMAYERNERYGSVDDLVHDLRSFLAGQAVSAYRETAIEAAFRRCRRQRKPILTAVAIALLVCFGCAGFFGYEVRKESVEIESLHSQAIAAEGAGNLEEARKHYEHILVRRPSDGDAHVRLAEVEEGIRTNIADIQRLRIREAATAKQVERAGQAEALRVTAVALLEEAKDLTSQVDELSRIVAGQEVELNDHGQPETRAVLHDQEQRLEHLARQRAADFAKAVSMLQQAHAIDPGHAAVRRALADYFIDRLRDAENAGDSAMAEANAAQARLFDEGRHGKLLDGLGTVTLAMTGPSCRLSRLEANSERIDAPAGIPIELSPGMATDLPHGRYQVDADNGIRFALRVGRGESLTLDPPSPPVIPVGTVFIPPGFAHGCDGHPPHAVAAFAIQAREVTCGEWLEFLNDPSTLRKIAERRQRDGQVLFVPREGVTQDIEPLWRQRGMSGRSATGTFLLELKDRTPVDPKQPVNWISYNDAVAYAVWMSERTKQHWRLPDRWEWELAAQGGDGRTYPWGQRADLSLCYSFVAGQRKGAKSLLPAGSFPADRTVQGVSDMAGSLAEFTRDSTADPALGAVMGGAHSDRQVDRFATWSRREIMRQVASSWCGFRLVVELP